MTEEQEAAARRVLPGDALGRLQQAVDHTQGTHRIEDVLAAVARGETQLWIGRGCVGVTEFINFPAKRVLNVFLAGGDVRELRDELLPGVEAFARGGGASAIMFCGRLTAPPRNGWGRLFPDFQPHWTCMMKELR